MKILTVFLLICLVSHFQPVLISNAQQPSNGSPKLKNDCWNRII